MRKKIVVFADGTGSAFTTQESNVWRLYQAIDQSQPDQIARYIKGVGTSGFRPYALIDGATGIGVPSDVRKLYRFVCWNWNPEDENEIYMFGFSRGSFTIRTLIGLIDSEGLLPTHIGPEPISHTEMQRNAMAAWRAYRAKTVPWRKSLPTIWIARWIRDALLALYHFVLGHRTYNKVREEIEAQGRSNVRVRFAGLFDTVEAFGVPIEEFRRAIDWAIWPISFRNQRLCDRVDSARHALSLDDERTTFHPLRFDMTAETTNRVKEVWFAGVHLDIGGGYPDSALAHVPLVWMAEEAEIATTNTAGQTSVTGVRFAPGTLDRFRAEASPFGPLHDSRAGLAVMYRYDPRPIAEDKARSGAPVIHHSVAAKMVFGSENYAPITLPSTALVLMPDGGIHEIHGFESDRVAKAARPMSGYKAQKMTVALQAVNELREPDKELVSLTRDTIWWRRVAYFALLLAVLLAASLPLSARPITGAFYSAVRTVAGWVGLRDRWDAVWNWLGNAQGGVGTNLQSISQTVGGFLPGYLKAWIDVVVMWPFTSGAVLLIAFLLYQWNGVLRDLIADLTRQAWFPSIRTASLTSKKSTFAGCMRKSRIVRWVHRAVAGFVLPGLGLALIFATIAVTVSRSTVSYRAGQGAFCRSQATPDDKLIPASEGTALVREGFQIDKLCWASGVSLEKGLHYTIWIEMVEPFFDQTIMTDIAGFRDLSLGHLTTMPVLRWWRGDWFQPIARIGVSGTAEWPLMAVDGAEALDVGVDVRGQPRPIRFYEAPEYASRLTELHRGDAKADPSRLSACDKIPEAELPVAQAIRKRQNLRTTYVSQFVAAHDGELFLFVNDAIAAIPFAPTIECFYTNNTGKAKVTIERTPAPKPAISRTK